MAKLKFVVDKNYDFEEIFYILSLNDPAGIEDRARGMKLDLAIAKKIQKLGKKRGSGFVHKIVNDRYEKLMPYLRRTLVLYQKSWDEINDAFFKLLEKKTGYRMKYKTYFCVVSAFHPGISNWGGNKIVRRWSENPFTMRRITGHELVISHIFNIFHDQLKIKGDNWRIWEIAEISAWLLLGLDKDFLKLWPWLSEEEKQASKHNYPQLYRKQEKLKEIFFRHNKFRDFLIEAYKYLKKLGS